MGDPEKRKQYDMFGKVGTGDMFGSPFTRAGFEGVMRDFGKGGLGFDFLKDIFDGFEFSNRPGRVELEFSDLTEKPFTVVPRWKTC